MSNNLVYSWNVLDKSSNTIPPIKLIWVSDNVTLDSTCEKNIIVYSIFNLGFSLNLDHKRD